MTLLYFLIGLVFFNDRDITRRLKEAGEVLGIAVLDHVIFSKYAYLSMFNEHSEEGVI